MTASRSVQSGSFPPPLALGGRPAPSELSEVVPGRRKNRVNRWSCPGIDLFFFAGIELNNGISSTYYHAGYLLPFSFMLTIFLIARRHVLPAHRDFDAL